MIINQLSLCEECRDGSCATCRKFKARQKRASKLRLYTYKGVRYTSKAQTIRNGGPPPGWCKCGTCGRSWDDSKSTGLTPTPAGRCPFEYWH